MSWLVLLWSFVGLLPTLQGGGFMGFDLVKALNFIENVELPHPDLAVATARRKLEDITDELIESDRDDAIDALIAATTAYGRKQVEAFPKSVEDARMEVLDQHLNGLSCDDINFDEAVDALIAVAVAYGRELGPEDTPDHMGYAGAVMDEGGWG
jgi:hypothetical protein